MAALFTAFDTTGLVTGITAILLVGVSIRLLYVGFKHIGKGATKM